MAYRLPQDADVFPVIVRVSYENIVMIALFQAVSSYKSRVRPTRKFNQSSVPRWVPVNKSFIALTKIILRSAAARLGLAQAAVTLRCLNHQGYRHLLLAEDVRDLFVAASGGAEEFIISTQEANISPFQGFDTEVALSFPVNFKTPGNESQRLGYLVVQMAPGAQSCDDNVKHELSLVIEEIVRVISRYQSRYRSIHWYGDQSFWIGNSAVLRQLDQRIDQLAKRNVPVVIRADKGMGKIIAARRLHDLTCSETAPFIESDCREWEEGTAAAILQSLRSCATGGTLFLRNLDALSAKDLLALRHFCLQWMAAARSGTSLALVFSLSSAAIEPVEIGLGWMVHFVQSLHLPTLNERCDDLRDLTRFFISELALANNLDLHESAWQLLEAHEFPEHVEGLKSLIKQLVLRNQGDLVSAEELHALL
jgi:hypothetical protein